MHTFPGKNIKATAYAGALRRLFRHGTVWLQPGSSEQLAHLFRFCPNLTPKRQADIAKDATDHAGRFGRAGRSIRWSVPHKVALPIIVTSSDCIYWSRRIRPRAGRQSESRDTRGNWRRCKVLCGMSGLSIDSAVA